MRIKISITVMLVAIVFLATSCSSINWKKLNPFKSSVSLQNEHQLTRDAIESYNKRNYKDAIEGFQTIKDQYPFSPYILLAELKIADAYYNRGEYPEATFEYEDFIKLHPQNEAIPYVLFQVGMCYFEQMPTIDRDQENTRKAVAEFQKLIRTYPDSPFRVRAENRLSICLQNLANHELYVAKFYFKKKDYKAALGRFQGIIQNFPDLGQYHESLLYIKKCDEKLKKIEIKEEKKRLKLEKKEIKT